MGTPSSGTGGTSSSIDTGDDGDGADAEKEDGGGGVEVAMTDTILHLAVDNGEIEFAPAAVNSSFRGTANDNDANSVGHKGESSFEQDDSTDIDIGDLGVSDGDDHASDDTE